MRVPAGRHIRHGFVLITTNRLVKAHDHGGPSGGRRGDARMGQMIRQISPSTTRYYWYPGDKKEWLRALLAFGAGGVVFGLAYLLTKSLLTATVLGLAVAAG